MTQPEQADLEERLQTLLAGDLTPEETRDLLACIVGDDAARERLREMLALQRQLRAAYGYDRAEPAMKRARAAFLRSLGGTGPAAVGGLPASGTARAARPVYRRLHVVLSAAAAIVLAASAYLAVTAHLQNRAVEKYLGQTAEPPAVPPVTPAERDSYRRIWNEVARGATGPKPWVLLSDGGGEFGYLPASGEGAGERLLLVRCTVLTMQGGRVETVSLLVPARRGLPLALPDVGRVVGRPMACRLVAHEGWVSVGVTVGKDSEAVGVQGRISLTNRAVEIGQLHLGGTPMRIVVEAVPLDGAMG